MKTFKYLIGGHTLSIKLDEKQGTIADILVDDKHPSVSSERMAEYAAVIALAIIEHDVEIVHDDESGVITLAGRHNTDTAWRNPIQMMNNKQL